MLHAAGEALKKSPAFCQEPRPRHRAPLHGRPGHFAVHAVFPKSVFWETLEAQGGGRFRHPRRPHRKDDDVKTLDWNSLDEDGRRAALARPDQRTDPQLQASVARIVAEVRAGGWGALCDIARRIDGAEPRLVDVAPGAAAARDDLSSEQLDAVEFAARNIRTFHEASRPGDVTIETVPGLSVGQVWRPIDRVGSTSRRSDASILDIAYAGSSRASGWNARNRHGHPTSPRWHP